MYLDRRRAGAAARAGPAVHDGRGLAQPARAPRAVGAPGPVSQRMLAAMAGRCAAGSLGSAAGVRDEVNVAARGEAAAEGHHLHRCRLTLTSCAAGRWRKCWRRIATSCRRSSACLRSCCEQAHRPARLECQRCRSRSHARRHQVRALLALRAVGERRRRNSRALCERCVDALARAVASVARRDISRGVTPPRDRSSWPSSSLPTRSPRRWCDSR